MDVKSGLLNGYIHKESFVKQAPGFKSPSYPNYIFKLPKELYRLKQTPKYLYERLSTFLLNNNNQQGKMDTTIFVVFDNRSTSSYEVFICHRVLI